MATVTLLLLLPPWIPEDGLVEEVADIKGKPSGTLLLLLLRPKNPRPVSAAEDIVDDDLGLELVDE